MHEITVALTFSRMTDPAFRVETTSRLAQWRIDNLSSGNFRKSYPFKIGKWNWYLTVEKDQTLYINLYPEILNLTGVNPPVASFIIKVIAFVGDRKVLVHPELRDVELTNRDDFYWNIEVPFPLTGGELCSIWPEGFTQKQLNATALASLGKMLSESIYTDIVINASDGSIGAHRSVLAARSPVFRSMFSHDLKEKESSTINISDMSIEVCLAFLSYIYGKIQTEEFLTHRLALLGAADKYDISDLKEACELGLVEDIDTKNVLERLQNATLYQLPKLKNSCLRYLVKFGKIFDMLDEFNAFLQCDDRELIAEIFLEVLAAWKGF